jgi:hypothetical protein
VRERGPLPVERLDGEAEAASTLAQLLGREARKGDARVSQEVSETPRNRRLADGRPALKQNPQAAARDLGARLNTWKKRS